MSLPDAVRENNIEDVLNLIESGADVNKLTNDEHGRKIALLHIAAKNGNYDMVELLLNHGAMVDIKDYNGNTPLHTATYNSKHDIVKLLLEHDATIDIENQDKDTPLVNAVLGNDRKIVKLLLDSGADVHKLEGDRDEDRDDDLTFLEGWVIEQIFLPLEAQSPDITLEDWEKHQKVVAEIVIMLIRAGAPFNEEKAYAAAREQYEEYNFNELNYARKYKDYFSKYFKQQEYFKQQGKNIAALKMASKHGTLQRLPNGIANRMAGFLTGEKGSLNEHRALIRRALNLNNNTAEIRAREAAAVSKATAPREPVGGAGAASHTENEDPELRQAIAALKAWKATQKKPRKQARKQARKQTRRTRK